MQSGGMGDRRHRTHDYQKPSAGAVSVKCLKVLLKYALNCSTTVWSWHQGVTYKRLWTLRPSKLESKPGSLLCPCLTEWGRGDVRASHLIIKHKGSTFSHSLAPTCVCQEKVNRLPFTWEFQCKGWPKTGDCALQWRKQRQTFRSQNLPQRCNGLIPRGPAREVKGNQQVAGTLNHTEVAFKGNARSLK